ncbi:LpxI family protein [Kaistia algarum]|uniref:LpxI family protein n=1 Tax=Kaistia algarum TaxID=2083279 RepID=UPI002259742E|nr:UDP-2,3-diacylglucosamine diphosphatase LpxI [Kaistia algarum]MCX5515296.1 UDP-2,3-diacylglucosamine diphosphatase LpxI [Kaistia algarum]
MAAKDAAPLALVCGGGSFPMAIADSALRDGRPVVLFAIRGFADPVAVERYQHEWIHLGAAKELTSALRRRGCRDIVIVGNVLRPHWWQIRLDWMTIRLLPRILAAMRGGDDHLLSRLAEFVEEQGFALLGAHDVAPDLLVPAGVFGSVPPRPADLEDARIGLELVRTLGPFDVGQGVVVAQRHVQAVEAAEGTDWMLERCALLRERGRVKLPGRSGVLVKAPKPGQDRRVDLPSIGKRTVEMAAKAGLAGIAVEAGGVLAVDVEDMIREADARGLFLFGLDP